MRVCKTKRSFDYRHYIAWAILIISLLSTFLLYRFPVQRMLQGFRDLWYSLRFYAVFLFTGDRTEVTVTQLPQFDLGDYFPWDVEEIARKLRDMWGIFFDGETFEGYLSTIVDWLYHGTMVVLCLLPAVLVGVPIFKGWLIAPTNDYAGEERPSVRRFQRYIENPCRVALGWLREFGAFFRERWYFWSFLLVWSVNLNIVTLILEFLAFYFYFVMSLDFLCLFVQLVKLLIDLIVMFSGAPLLFWCAVAMAVADLWRRSVGFDRLERFERKNRAFLQSLP